jgi:hypothetical protein
MTDTTFERGRQEAVKGRRWLTGGGKRGYRLNPDGTWKEALVEGLEETGGNQSNELPEAEAVLALSRDLAELLKKV